MARSTQNDPQRQSAPEVERVLHDRAEIAGLRVNPIDRSIGSCTAHSEPRLPSERLLAGHERSRLG
jgi:hypothetical protein